MNNANNKGRLRKICLFRDLTDGEFDSLSPLLKRRVYPGDEIIFEEGASGRVLYLIAEGEVEVSTQDPDGHRRTLTLLKAGAMFGELSFISGEPHSATVRAITETEVYFLRMEAFEKLLPEHALLVFKMMRSIVCHIRSVVSGLNHKYAETVEYMWGRKR